MGAYIPACARLRLRSAERHLPRHARTRSRTTPSRRIENGEQDLRRHQRAERRLRSRPRDPDRAPSARATATSSTAPRSGSPARQVADWGMVFARTGRARAAAASPASSSRRRQGLHAEADPGDPLLLRPTRSSSTMSRCRSRTASARRARASSSPRPGWCTARIPYAAGDDRHRAGGARARDRLGASSATPSARALADKQAIQWMLADSEIELRAARLLVYQAAWKADLGAGHQGRRLDRQGLRHRDRRPRRRPLHPDVRRARRRAARCRWSAGIASCASSASARARPRCTAWCVARDLLGARGARRPDACRSISTSTTASRTITINRPERLNAMDAEHYQALSEAWMRVRDDADDPRRDHHRRGRQVVQHRRRHQELPRPRRPNSTRCG